MLDRRRERAAIDRVLDSVRKGFSGTLVLQGGHGTGKTRLLEYAIDSAPDLRISSVIGVESEISLEFAALHQLLVPFKSLLAALPAPQRDAMKIAFGLEEGPAPDLFLVGLATLTLLSLAAEDQPLLCVIDDGHWIDRESAHVLGFAARRLYADRVGFIAAVGEPSASQVLEQLPVITVGGLPDAEARELLGSVIDGPLDAQVAARILADTHNNPLALVELGTEYTAEQLAGRAALPEPLPVGQRLRDRFLRQIRDLPPDAQAFVLLAAADVSGERSLLWRAAEQTGIDADAAAAAADGVLEFSGNSVRFRHPLLRSAAYHGATDSDRRRAHAALAEAASSESDLDQRTWHRAAAAIVPDEELATELEHAADRARARGGYAAAAALLRRSAELTPGDGARAEREVALADAELRAGHAEQARELVGAAIPRLTDDVARGLANAADRSRSASRRATRPRQPPPSPTRAGSWRRMPGWPGTPSLRPWRRRSGPDQRRHRRSQGRRRPFRLPPRPRPSPTCCSRGTAPDPRPAITPRSARCAPRSPRCAPTTLTPRRACSGSGSA